MTVVRYANTESIWDGFPRLAARRIRQSGARQILEIGAGANPTFTLDELSDSQADYTLLDISSDELEKAPPGYRTVVADIGAPDLKLERQYDFVFSRMLAEHVEDAFAFHRNIFRLLTNGGLAVHFFPTLYAPPFVANRLLPERLASSVVRTLQPGRLDSGKQNKFPAYYEWCRGPTRRQVKRFEALGYAVDEYLGCFGHDGYYNRIPWVKSIHNTLVAYLVRHPLPALTSFAYVVLRKP